MILTPTLKATTMVFGVVEYPSDFVAAVEITDPSDQRPLANGYELNGL